MVREGIGEYGFRGRKGEVYGKKARYEGRKKKKWKEDKRE